MHKSDNTKHIVRTVHTIAILMIFLLGGTSGAAAQMFSVKSLPTRYNPPMASGYFSIIPTNFHSKPSGNLSQGQVLYNFRGQLYRLGFDLAGLEIMGTGGWNLGAQKLNYFGMEIGFNTRYPLLRTPPFILSIPVNFKISYTRVNNKNNSDVTNEFRQNTATVGTGLHTDFRLPRRIRISLEGTANYGFSSEALGQSSGSAWIIENRDRVYFDRVFGQVGIVAGFHYRFTRFNGSGTRSDYAERNIGFLLGLTF